MNIKFTFAAGGGALALLLFINVQVFSQALWQPSGADKVYTLRKTGINTNNPSEMLDVNGRTKFRGNAYFDSLTTAFAMEAQKAVFISLTATNAVVHGILTADNITSSSGKIDFGNNDLTTSESITGGKIYASQLNATGHGNFGATVNYNSDLSAAYSNRSLVDKEYVDNKVASIPPPSIPSLSSVLTAGRNADAAGTINDNAGTLAIDINNRKLSNADGNLKIDWEQGYLYNAPANVLSLKWNSRELIGTDGSTAALNWANRKLQSGRWEYDADYSGSYTNRSLVDKQYVDGKVASASSLFSAGTGQYSVMNNLAGGNSAQAQSSFIGSGNNNTIAPNAIYGIILGGNNNQIQNAAVALPQYNLIGNGSGNTTASTSQYSFIASGQNNRIEGKWSSVLSGISNLNQANHSFIGTGQNNTIYPNAEFGVILSGRNNTIQNAVAAGPADEDKYNFISSGSNNTIQSNAHHSSIIGGKNNIISNGVENSVILGGSNITATQSNTVYVPKISSSDLAITNLAGTGDRYLLVDANGSLKTAGTFAGSVPWETRGNDISGDPQAFFGTQDNSNIIFKTYSIADPSEKMVITTTGKVGIGTSNPLEKLHVDGSARFADGANDYVIIGNTNFPTAKLNVIESTSNVPAIIAGDPFTKRILFVPNLDAGTLAFNGIVQQGDAGIFYDGFNINPQAGFVIAPSADNSTVSGIRITSGGNVGIGTTSPGAKLQVTETGAAHGILTSSVGGNGIVATVANGGNAVVGTANNGSGGVFSSTNGFGLLVTSGNVGIGVATPQNKLEVCGTIRAREIIVDETAWCDFVFDNNYKRMTFDEQKEYYTTNKRLKGIASEKQIVENGLPVSETMKGFVQNLEEARLDAIDLYDMIQELKKENEMMKQKIKSLENK